MYTPKWSHIDILYFDTDLTKFHLQLWNIITVYIYIGSPGIFSWLDFGGPKQPESQSNSFFSPGE